MKSLLNEESFQHLKLALGSRAAEPGARPVAAVWLWPQPITFSQGMVCIPSLSKARTSLPAQCHLWAVPRGPCPGTAPGIGIGNTEPQPRAAGSSSLLYSQNSRNQLGWKRFLRLWSPACGPTPPCQLDHGTKCHIQSFPCHLQERRLHHLPGQPVPMSDHPFYEEILSSVQHRPPLEQLEALSPRPVAGSLGAEPDPPGLLSGSCRK